MIVKYNCRSEPPQEREPLTRLGQCNARRAAGECGSDLILSGDCVTCPDCGRQYPEHGVSVAARALADSIRSERPAPVWEPEPYGGRPAVPVTVGNMSLTIGPDGRLVGTFDAKAGVDAHRLVAEIAAAVVEKVAGDDAVVAAKAEADGRRAMHAKIAELRERVQSHDQRQAAQLSSGQVIDVEQFLLADAQHDVDVHALAKLDALGAGPLSHRTALAAEVVRRTVRDVVQDRRVQLDRDIADVRTALGKVPLAKAGPSLQRACDLLTVGALLRGEPTRELGANTLAFAAEQWAARQLGLDV